MKAGIVSEEIYECCMRKDVLQFGVRIKYIFVRLVNFSLFR